MKTGVLLINLGTPSANTPDAVGAYLKEFLMDRWVIDIPAPFRWFLVNVLIVPRRKFASSELYRKVWTPEGSPLLVYHIELTEKLRAELGQEFMVAPAMRYGEPAIQPAIRAMKIAGVSRLIVAPLYPQYSLAATQSSIEEVQTSLDSVNWKPPLTILPPFYDESAYLDAVAEVSRPTLASKPWDLALFSFHGLPERQVKKTDPSRAHCLESAACCDRIVDANKLCYRAQCFATARSLAQRLGIPPDRYQVAFQSRLGRTPWIRPFSDELYRTLPGQGVKRLIVLCPSFVADCLETLEEVALRGDAEFRAHGGESLTLVPSLNASDAWVKALASMLRK